MRLTAKFIEQVGKVGSPGDAHRVRPAMLAVAEYGQVLLGHSPGFAELLTAGLFQIRHLVLGNEGDDIDDGGPKPRCHFGNVGDVNEYKDNGYSNDGTVYYWRVRAGNDVNWSTFSTVWSFTNWN